MRRYGPIAFLIATCAGPAGAADWLDARRLTQDELRGLCDRASAVKLLARMQMLSSPDAEWRQLSRQALTIEGFTMGGDPLDPAKCYVVARVGKSADLDSMQRRAFEVRDFAHSPERTLVMVVGPQTPLGAREVMRSRAHLSGQDPIRVP
jgi:hypothetical protein